MPRHGRTAGCGGTGRGRRWRSTGTADRGRRPRWWRVAPRRRPDRPVAVGGQGVSQPQQPAEVEVLWKQVNQVPPKSPPIRHPSAGSFQSRTRFRSRPPPEAAARSATPVNARPSGSLPQLSWWRGDGLYDAALADSTRLSMTAAGLHGSMPRAVRVGATAEAAVMRLAYQAKLDRLCLELSWNSQAGAVIDFTGDLVPSRVGSVSRTGSGISGRAGYYGTQRRP